MRGIAVVALLVSMLSGCATAWAPHARPLGVVADATLLAGGAMVVGGIDEIGATSTDLRGKADGFVTGVGGVYVLGIGAVLELFAGIAELMVRPKEHAPPSPPTVMPPSPPAPPLDANAFEDLRHDQCAEMLVALGRLHAADEAAYQRAVLQPDVAICVSGSRP